MAVTNIYIIENDENPPFGWEKDDHDLNAGAGGDYVYVVWEKDENADPVTDLYVLDNETTPPPATTRSTRTSRRGPAATTSTFASRRRGASPSWTSP